MRLEIKVAYLSFIKASLPTIQDGQTVNQGTGFYQQPSPGNRL